MLGSKLGPQQEQPAVLTTGLLSSCTVVWLSFFFKFSKERYRKCILMENQCVTVLINYSNCIFKNKIKTWRKKIPEEKHNHPNSGQIPPQPPPNTWREEKWEGNWSSNHHGYFKTHLSELTDQANGQQQQKKKFNNKISNIDPTDTAFRESKHILLKYTWLICKNRWQRSGPQKKTPAKQSIPNTKFCS